MAEKKTKKKTSDKPVKESKSPKKPAKESKSPKKPAKEAKKTSKSKKQEESSDDMGIVIFDDDVGYDKEKEMEERRAYLEEARSQEAFD